MEKQTEKDRERCDNRLQVLTVGILPGLLYMLCLSWLATVHSASDQQHPYTIPLVIISSVTFLLQPWLFWSQHNNTNISRRQSLQLQYHCSMGWSLWETESIYYGITLIAAAEMKWRGEEHSWIIRFLLSLFNLLRKRLWIVNKSFPCPPRPRQRGAASSKDINPEHIHFITGCFHFNFSHMNWGLHLNWIKCTISPCLPGLPTTSYLFQGYWFIFFFCSRWNGRETFDNNLSQTALSSPKAKIVGGGMRKFPDV